MFWIARILATIVLLVVLIYGVGLLMPSERSVTKTTLIDAVPELVFDVITDVESFPLWRSDLRSLTVDERGDRWKWTEVHHGGTTVRVHETVKEPLVGYTFAYENSSGIGGSWSGTFEPSGDTRTKLNCTETVVVDNPLLRLPAFVLMNIGARLDVFLGDLNRRAVDLGPKEKQSPLILP
jgi:uncharacterized protein YndB with AHSA1/START domain